MYVKKIYDLGDYIETENHFPGNYGAPGVKRGPKRKRTPEDIRRQNEYNREKRVQRLIIANFKEGDWHVVLNYGKDKPDPEEAKRTLRDFLKKTKNLLRKFGKEFKYIAVTERGRKGKILHHHLILEDLDGRMVKLVRKTWNQGNKYFYPLYEDGNFGKLSEYILKKEGKEGIGSYTRSRNLIVPVPEIRKMKRKIWKAEPPPKKGFYIIKDSILNGFNPVTGLPYQHYAQKRLSVKIRGKTPADPKEHREGKD